MKILSQGTPIALALLLGVVPIAYGTPLGFEILNTSVLTSPYALTTSNLYVDERAGSTYIHNIGFDTLAADFTIAPEQWATDAILGLLGLDDTVGIVGVNESLTLRQFTTTLKLTGDPGVKARVDGLAYVGGIYNQLIGAIPSGDAQSRVRFDYSINGSSITREETSKNTNNTAAASETGAWLLPGSTVPEFFMTVGETVSIVGEFSVRSFAEVNEACAEVCVPFTDLCTDVCVPGAGFAVSKTGGVGGIELNVTEIPVRVPEPASLALLGLGIAGMGYQRHRRAKAE